MGWRETIGATDAPPAPPAPAMPPATVGPVPGADAPAAEPDAAPATPPTAAPDAPAPAARSNPEPVGQNRHNRHNPGDEGSSVPCVGSVRANSDRDAGDAGGPLEVPVQAVTAPAPAEPEADRVAQRWRGFVALCVRLGLHADVVAEDFTDDDVADLADPTHDADVLARCAATVAADPRLVEASAARRATERAATAGPAVVTCGACRHLRRQAGRPHDGHCGAGSPDVTSAVLWDTTPRACRVFEPAGDAP